MHREIKDKLEEIVALLNDPEETVLEKEIKEKLEKIVLLLDNPETLATEQEAQEKIDKIVALVNNASVDPDIDVEYCPPDASGIPYLLITYIVGEYNKPTRKVRLGKTILQNTPQEVANQVTFSIEEFKSEIDSVEMG